MRYRAKYRQSTQNSNRKDHQKTFIGALSHINIHIQHIDSSILNLHNRVRKIKAPISCDKNTVKTLEAEVKKLLWEKINEEVSIHTKLERILKNYKVTIQAYNDGTLTTVAILNLLKNRNQIMDEIRELCVDAINNHDNYGHTLFPPTVE